MKRIILSILCILLIISACGCDNEKLYNKTVTSVVALKVDNSKGSCIGTGFFALEPDIIVTCYHVVEGATNITAKTNKGDIISIEGIIDYSKEKDIALLKASSKNSTLLELQVNMPTPGTPAYVLGSPKGLDFTFSDGVISQIRREKETLIQFTCPVSPGNSGGPLLSEDGKVIGIVSCQLTEGQNLNFAVPSASVYTLNKDNNWQKLNKQMNSQDYQSNEHFQYGKKYLEAGLYSEAISEFVEVLKVFPESLEVYHYICFSLLKADEYENLKKITNEAIKISINSNNKTRLGAFYLFLGEAYRIGDRDVEKAIKYYKLALDENADDSTSGILNYLIGDSYLSLDEKNNPFSKNHYYIKEAIIYYEKALKFNSKNYDAAYGLGRCYSYLKEYKKSNQYFELALNNDTEKTLYYSILGFIALNYQLMKDYDQAINYYQKSLVINPNSFSDIDNIGDCYVGKKEYRKAIDYYQKSLSKVDKVIWTSLSISIGKVHYKIGDCYYELHEYNKAIDFLQKALKIYPNYESAKGLLKECKKQLRKK